MSHTQKTYGPAAAPIIEDLESRKATLVSTNEMAAIKGVPAASVALHSLIQRLIKSGWLIPLARQGWYEFVPVRAGAYGSGDELRELEALAQAPKAPPFQVALGSAAFLRGYAPTAPSIGYVLVSKEAGVRPRGLQERFRVIRTNPARIFGGEPIAEGSRVPVSTASRLYIDAALFWQHAGDLRVRDHWLSAAAHDVDAARTARWARKLGRTTVVRVGFLAERFGPTELATLLLARVERSALVSFGPQGKGAWDPRWHVYDSIGIGLSR